MNTLNLLSISDFLYACPDLSANYNILSIETSPQETYMYKYRKVVQSTSFAVRQS